MVTETKTSATKADKDHLKNTGASAEERKAAKDPVDPVDEIKGSGLGSVLMRIALRFRAAAAWGHPALSKAADALEAEVIELDPKLAPKFTKDDLQEKTDAAKAAVAKAEAVLANGTASAAEHKAAAEAIEKAGT